MAGNGTSVVSITPVRRDDDARLTFEVGLANGAVAYLTAAELLSPTRARAAVLAHCGVLPDVERGGAWLTRVRHLLEGEIELPLPRVLQGP